MNYPYSLSSSNRKIDPSRRRNSANKPDGSPNDNDRIEIGPTDLAFDEWQELGLQCPDLQAMREFRLERIKAELVQRDLAGVLLFDPLNIRYATDSTNMQVWITHNYGRACFVAASGYMVLFDFHSCAHLSSYLPLVREVRGGASFFYFETAYQTDHHAAKFAATIDDLMKQHAGDNKRLAIDKIEIAGVRAFDNLGVDIASGQEVMEFARVVKGPDEIKAMRCSLASTEISMALMHQATEPGITENDIWAVLHAENIRRGGEWIECRLLSSGPRTNPWFQESGPRLVQNGELLSFDTDLVGPYGICADLSRTWMIGDQPPTAEQKRLYRTAYEHIKYNESILEPGMSFEDITRLGQPLQDEFRAGRYGVMMHGVGLCDEYPSIRYPEDYAEHGYNGEVVPGMTLCVEAYMGSDKGGEGVKLEDQILITEDGVENLTNYPFEQDLLA